MVVTSEVADGVAIYRIVGRIDAATSPNLQSAVRSSFTDVRPLIMFDMREVSFVSSAGLRIVLMMAKQAAATKGCFVIFGVQREVQKVFEVSGLQTFIPIASNETEAYARLGRARET